MHFEKTSSCTMTSNLSKKKKTVDIFTYKNTETISRLSKYLQINFLIINSINRVAYSYSIPNKQLFNQNCQLYGI